MKKIAVQGFTGSYHALAARSLFGPDNDLLFCSTFREVFESVSKKDADIAVVAIENSLYGSIHEVYDLLLRYQFNITAEIYEQISLNLLGCTTARLEDITDVYSQGPALAEAQQFITEKLPEARVHTYQDTSLAAQMVADQKNINLAAIASRAAARQFGLKILAANIETHHDNYTRFLALDPDAANSPLKASKTSITFRTNDAPGSLHAALGVFARRHINLTKLESRPIIGEAWQYMYYVDCSANIDEATILDLQKYADNIRILGRYKSGLHEHLS